MGSIQHDKLMEMSKVEVTRESIKGKLVHCPATEALSHHCQEFEKKVYKITDGVYVAVGYALANSILLEGPEGLVVVDTTESVGSMKEIWAEFRKISDKPLKGVIYSHSHEDHCSGTTAMVDNEGEDIEVWAHEKFLKIKETYDTLLRGVMLPRNMRQFGLPLNEMGALLNSGIGPFPHNDFKSDEHLVWPNRLMTSETTHDITLAGLDLQLVYIPGETMCQMGVWIPSKRVFLPGDNFYRAFPNLYAIRGTVPRSVICWIDSLDTIRHMRPEYLVPAHSRPLSGEDYIFEQLTSYRDAIQFVHDQTLRRVNLGIHPVEVARSIELPMSLQKVPYLQSFYGTPEWSSRAIFDSYIGWFSGSPEDLFPLTPKERGKKMAESFKPETILAVAESAVEKGDYQWAMELASNVFLADDTNDKAKEIRTKAILGVASQQVSANGRNYLLTYLLEEYGLHPRRWPSASVVLAMPLEYVFKRMAFEIKAEEVEDVVMTVVIKFTDLDQTYSLHVRNCVLEVEEKEREKRDLYVTMSSESLRQIMAGLKTSPELIEEGKITIDDKQDILVSFFGCFETGDEFVKVYKDDKESENEKQDS